MIVFASFPPNKRTIRADFLVKIPTGRREANNIESEGETNYSLREHHSQDNLVIYSYQSKMRVASFSKIDELLLNGYPNKTMDSVS